MIGDGWIGHVVIMAAFVLMRLSMATLLVRL